MEALLQLLARCWLFAVLVVAVGAAADTICKGQPNGTFLEHPTRCSTFYRCGQNGQGYNFTCKPDYYFDIKTKRCLFAAKVDCKTRGGYDYYGADHPRQYETGLFWGPPLSKGNCHNVFCSMRLQRGNTEVFEPRQLDPRFCTHLLVANVKLDDGMGLVPADWTHSSTDAVAQDIASLMKIRQVYPDVKIMASVGHLNPSDYFRRTVTSYFLSTQYMDKLANALRRYSFDGLHLHWTYPDSKIRSKLAKWIRTLGKRLWVEEALSEKPKLLLAISIPPNPHQISAFVPFSLTYSVDFAFLLGYDLHGSWRKTAEGDTRRSPVAGWTVDKAIRRWVDREGFPKEKLILGIRLAPARYQRAASPTTPPEILSSSAGCRKSGQRAVDEVYGPGYTLALVQGSDKDSQVTVTEDNISLKDKVELAVSDDLGGIFLTDINDDDYTGQTCGAGQYPLLKAAQRTCTESRGHSTSGYTNMTSLPSDRLRAAHESVQHSSPGCGVLFCFYSNEFRNPSPMTQMSVKDVDPTYCTHLGYRSFLLTNTTKDATAFAIKPAEERDRLDVQGLVDFRKLFPGLMIMLSVTDPTWDAVHFTRMARSDEESERVAWDAIYLLNELGLDGIDLDWDIPLDNSIERFPAMLETFRRVFEQYATVSGRKRPKLSASVHAHALALGYYAGQLQRISKALDVLRFDTSELIYQYEGILRISKEERKFYRPDIDTVLRKLLDEKVDPRKVAMALPFFAKVFKVKKSPSGDRFDLLKEVPLAESNLKGKALYPEVCRLQVGKDEPKDLFIPRKVGQYLLVGPDKDVFVSYEDETSLRLKMKLLRQHNLGGGFIKNLVADDFSGKYCNHGRFPLLSAVGEECTVAEKPTMHTSFQHIDNRGLTKVPSVGCELLVCYYENKATLRPGKGKVMPSQLDVSMCTHLIFSSAKLSGTSVVQGLASDLGDKGLYSQAVGLKKVNPALKVLLSIQVSYLMDDTSFRAIATSPQRIRELAKNCVQYLRKHKFDGAEIFWVYQKAADIESDEKSRYTFLLQTFAEEFSRQAQIDGMAKLILAARVSGTVDVINRLYDIPRVSDIVDFLLVNTYSWYTWSTYTLHHGPIFKKEGLRNPEILNNNAAATIDHWLKGGAPSRKLVLGIGLYAHTFTLSDPKFWEVGDPTTEAGLKGNYTQTFGELAYFEVCQLRAAGGQEHFLWDQLVPFLVHEDQWVGFDNDESVRQKVRFAKLYGLAGVSLVSLDADDFSGGFCQASPFPLLTAARRECSVVGSDATLLKQAHTARPADVRKERFRRVCYISKESLSRPRPATFDVEYIKPNLCTHLILQGLAFDQEGVITSLTPPVLNAFRAMKLLKKDNGTALYLPSVSDTGGTSYSKLIGNSTKMHNFFESLKTMILSQEADGVDFLWSELHSTNARVLTQLLREAKKLLVSQSWWKNLTLTLTLRSLLVKEVDYKVIFDTVDFVTVLNAPRRDWSSLGHSVLVEDFKGLINAYVAKGIRKDKIVAGLSLYADTFYLLDKKRYAVGNPAIIGPAGATSGQKGSWPYYEVCFKMQETGNKQTASFSGYLQGKPVPHSAPTYYDERIWISYDSRNRIQDKVMWVKSQGLGGYALVTLDADVFAKALCDFSTEEFPLAEGARLAAMGFHQFEALASSSPTHAPWGFQNLTPAAVLNVAAAFVWHAAAKHLSGR